jgi:hypothetical protein
VTIQILYFGNVNKNDPGRNLGQFPDFQEQFGLSDSLSVTSLSGRAQCGGGEFRVLVCADSGARTPIGMCHYKPGILGD